MSKQKSVLVNDMNTCYECGLYGTEYQMVEAHHVLFGSYQKTNCTKRKLLLPLCSRCHKGNAGPHMNREKDLEYKMMAQEYYEENIGTREEFRMEFGRSYL